MALRTGLTERLGIRHPILLAPMGSSAGGALAAAVSAAGGLGLIGGGQGTGGQGLSGREWLEGQFATAGNQLVGCGFITWGLARRPAMLDVALAHAPAAMMLSFGDAAPFIPRIRDAGIPVICQVQTLTMARQVLDQGADIIVAQGGEGGGHGSTRRGTLALVPAVVDMVAASGRDVPVVAAGGIADGRGLAAALMLGAAGVLIGTRFCASEEWLGTPKAKARLVAGGGDDTLRTRIFDIARDIPWPEEFPGRGFANRFTASWQGREAELQQASADKARYADACAAEDFDTAVVWAGEGVDLVHSVEPAGAIVARIAAEAEATLARRFD
ncbi:MAG TPA: nitronate monooxygenase [Stellaceae bacterium]|nr:nitronate monooxygenase [Stellaceae bacterium]